MMMLELPIDVASDDGTVQYEVDAFEATTSSLTHLWEHYGKNGLLQPDFPVDNALSFAAFIMRPDVLLFTVKQDGRAIGFLYAVRYNPPTDAVVNFVFFDETFKGRHRLILTWCRWLVGQFDVYRLNIEVPEYAFALLKRMQKLGVRLEGRRREALSHDGRWWDMLELGIVSTELSNEAIEANVLQRTPSEMKWFKLLKMEDELMHAILKEE